ncbi:hypothetical protein Daus18300_002233 [Diaporthe australafricana]|uniref:Major facilitator superfamily (MFS) profile domain-containing protein n=1 Tax=Diaporthe australafricana TaxID=127596 RepID=A0ABR3XQ73_9PEZI
MSDKGGSVAEIEELTHEPHVGRGSPGGSGSGSGSANIIDDDDSKAALAHLSNNIPPQTGAGSGVRRGLQPPEFLLHMSMEQRQELETKLMRKIDLRLMPAIILMYILNYIDRNNIAAAKLAGLEEDLGLSSTEYETAVSILFVGYLLMQIPSNLFLNKLGKPALYLPTCMIVWGIISAATASCHNAAGLLSVRFFLGFVEAAYFPGTHHLDSFADLVIISLISHAGVLST